MKIKAEHIKLVLPWQNLRTSEVVRHKVKVISVICSEKRQKSGGVQKLRIVENQGGLTDQANFEGKQNRVLVRICGIYVG